GFQWIWTQRMFPRGALMQLYRRGVVPINAAVGNRGVPARDRFTPVARRSCSSKRLVHTLPGRQPGRGVAWGHDRVLHVDGAAGDLLKLVLGQFAGRRFSALLALAVILFHGRLPR